MGHAVVEVRTGRAMASHVEVILVDPADGATELAFERLEQLERRWSRFREDSELSALIRSPERAVAVSEDTLVLLATMERAHLLTGGAYDPTMLNEIVGAGYGRSRSGDGLRSITIALPAGPAAPCLADIQRDDRTGTVRIPSGLGLDPGGIGKGLAADLVAGELLRGGTGGALVSIGGDLAAAGRPPATGGWTVDVADPFAPGEHLLTLEVGGGGIATSSTLSRRWSHRGATAHHVLDPRTGTSSATDLATVTAMAATGWEAEAHATAALVAGRAGARSYLHSAGCSGVVIALDGAVELTDDLVGAAA